MELQEIFEFAVEHLRRQGERSVESPGMSAVGCKYRGPNGLKCAIGAFIPDEEYNEDMESLNAFVINPPPAFRNEKGDWLSDKHQSLAGALQGAHDESTTPEVLNKKLEIIRVHWSLKPFAPIEKWR